LSWLDDLYRFWYQRHVSHEEIVEALRTDGDLGAVNQSAKSLCVDERYAVSEEVDFNLLSLFNGRCGQSFYKIKMAVGLNQYA
jgi:hypothetical protein